MAGELMQDQDARRALAAAQNGQVDPLQKGEFEAVLTGGLSEDKLRDLLADLRQEVPWRREADIDCDYFDHRQLSPEALEQLEEWGLPPAMADIVHPTISAVLGIQAQTRTDWQVDWDDDESENVARALGRKLADEERKTRADRALSEVYAAQIKSGLGWCEVNRVANPFAPSKYRVQEVHRREMWWDWRAKNIDLTDGRYKVRRQWYDVDYLTALFPNMREVIEASFAGWGALDSLIHEGSIAADRFGASWDRERTLAIEDEEWRDQSRRRAVLFEIWYRVWKRGVIARVGDRVVKIDTKNPNHVALIAAQRIVPEIAVYPEMRLSFWIGPHRIFDKKSPLPHDNDPYTPFWGYRADADKAPFGMIRGMRWPQDEVNTRLSKMLSLLTSKRVIMESSALDPSRMDEDELRRELSQHTAIIQLRDGGLTKRKFIVEENSQLSAQQFSVYTEMKSLISEVSNVYAPMMGREKGGQSGVAINQLVEQGMTSLAEINDNFNWGQREVGEQLLSFIMSDSTHEHDVVVGEKPTAVTIGLNKKVQTEDGGWTVDNAVKFANVKVSLSEVPQTPTYRQRVFTMIAEAVKSMPPQMQAVMSPMMIEMSNLPGRKEAARFLRTQLGLPDPNAPAGAEDPALAAAKQQYEPIIQQLQQQLQQAQQQLQEAGQVAQQAQQAANDKRADQAIKGREVMAKSVAEDRQSQAAIIEAQARMVEARGKAQAEVMRANTEANRPVEKQPQFDPKALTDGLMKSLEQAVTMALAPILKEVATMQGQMQAMGGGNQQQAPVINMPPITVNTPPMTIEKGAIEVNVPVNVAAAKPVAKEITLPDGGKATITPKKE